MLDHSETSRHAKAGHTMDPLRLPGAPRGQSLEARRWRDLVRGYAQLLGPERMERPDVRARLSVVISLTLLLERLEAEVASGTAVDANVLIQASQRLGGLLVELGLTSVPRDAAPTLGDVLRDYHKTRGRLMNPLIPMREALANPNLLGNALVGDSWHTWRTILIAAMGEPLTDKELVTFRAVTGRDVAPTMRCDELIGIVGRRGGKSRAIAVLATYLAALVDYSDALAPGERGLLLCVAPDIRQANIVHGYVEGVFETSPVLRPLLDTSSRSSLKLTNGIEVEVRAANWRRLRGITCVAAIADESCFWFSDEHSANRDNEILQAIRPALATTHGMLAIISTPYSRRGATWEAFSRDFGVHGDPSVLVATGASRTFNPSLSESVIARAYERDPVAAAAEYGGEWRTDIAAFLTREAVTACVDGGVAERPYCSDFRYSAFVDPSGGSNDSFALAISHLEADRRMLDLIREVRPPFSPEGVVAEFCETLAAYRVKRVTGDRYAGEWPREQFLKRGVTYTPADKTASQLFLEMLPLINGAQVGLLDHRRLIDQLIGLERRTAFSGKDSVGHPPGSHDDIANAVAGALTLAGAKQPRMRMGAIDTDGFIHWRGEEPRNHSRIRWITVDKDDIEVRR